MATTATSNVLLQPPRLSGDPQQDTLTLQRWLKDLFDALVNSGNVLGRLTALETAVATNAADIQTIKTHLGI